MANNTTLAEPLPGATMRAIAKIDSAPGLRMMEMPVPRPGPGEVLVRVQANSICGTDLHILDWDPWARHRVHPPLIVGHEFCGTVVATAPDVLESQPGDYVAAESHITCGQCEACRIGDSHVCEKTRILGVDRHGAFAEYICLPARNLWKLPSEMPVEIATLQENFGNAVHTAMATDLTGKYVLLSGCGPVGIMALLVARAAGAAGVLATDISEYRLGLAERLGAHWVHNANNGDLTDLAHAKTGGQGMDVLLEMSGAASAITEGFKSLRSGGEAMLLGIPREPLLFDLAEDVIFKGIRVTGIVGRRLWQTWDQATRLQKSGAVNLASVVTHRFPIESYQQALDQMASGNSGKVVLMWD